MNRKFIFLLFLALFYPKLSLTSSLDMEWQHFISPPGLKNQLKDYAFLKWNQKNNWQAKPFRFNSHIQAEYALDRSRIFYFNVSELYFAYKYKMKKPLYFINSIELNVGRKIKIWSLADEYWDLGLWNPLNRWNPLHPQTDGLVGSLLTLKSHQWSVDFFLGALHLSAQEAQLVEENGELYSRSRWFSPLPNQIDTLNVDINYFIRTPFVFDVLFQQSYLLSFKTWSSTPETYYWMKWALADKPVNHSFTVLNETNLLRLEQNGDSLGSVNQKITTLPVRQRILSAEWGLDYNNFSAVFTLENTKMREVEISPKGWSFFNRRENFTYFSSLLKYNFRPKSFIQVAYIQSWFKNYNIQSNNEIGKKTPSILQRYKVLRGIGVDWQTEFLSSKGLKRVFTLNYRYHFLNEGAWLFLQALYYITPQIYSSVGVDILGGKTGESQKNFLLSKYRHNDFFSWRWGYEF